MSVFTSLEMKVLATIIDDQAVIGEHLGRLLESAQISQRDNTGHGFFTSFEVAKFVGPIEWPQRWIDGPNAVVMVGGEALEMGFILWLEAGFPNCVEGFQYGSPDRDDIDLRVVDLGAIKWSGLMP